MCTCPKSLNSAERHLPQKRCYILKAMATSNWKCRTSLLHSSSGRMPENIESKSHFTISPMLCAPWSPRSQSRFLLIKWMSPLIKFHLGLGAGTKLCLPSEQEGMVKDRWEKLPLTLCQAAPAARSPGLLVVRERQRERGTLNEEMLDGETGQKSPRDGKAYSVWVFERTTKN